MSDLDEILDYLIEDYHHCEPERHYCNQDTASRAKQAIQDWALDIVGEDEDWKDNDYAKFSIAIDGGEAMRALYEHRNKLRAELRKQIGSDE